MTLAPLKRLDLSNSVIHLTRERIERTPQMTVQRIIPAFDVLKEILTSAVIKGSGNDGYIKGPRKAVCMSEMPLSAISAFAKPPEEEGKYRFYGIAMSKESVFAAGARPVIYLPDKEGQWIPDNEKWRHVRYEHGSINWTHEREWRAPDDLDLTKVLGLYVFVWTPNEVKPIIDLKCPVQDKIRGVIPMEHLRTML